MAFPVLVPLPGSFPAFPGSCHFLLTFVCPSLRSDGLASTGNLYRETRENVFFLSFLLLLFYFLFLIEVIIIVMSGIIISF